MIVDEIVNQVPRNVATNTRVFEALMWNAEQSQRFDARLQNVQPAIKCCPHKIPLFTILQVGGLDDSSRSYEAQ